MDSANGKVDRVVYNYSVTPAQGWQEMMLPAAAKILHVDVDLNPDYLRMWVLLNPDVPTFATRYALIGTGWPVPNGAEHVHTILLSNGFVWHLFRDGHG